MKKYFKLILAAIIALVFIGTFVFLWKQSQPQPIVYDEFTPEVKDVVRSTIVTGKIEPRDEVNVKPQISGIITHIYKEAGDMVQAGEVIAKVKVIPDMQQLSAAQARVRLANVNANQAKIDYDRVKTLFDKGYISADEHDKVAQNYRQAREELTAANDQLQVIRDGVSRTNASASSTLIRSTITGLILDVPVKVGNSVILSNTFNDGTTIASVANMGDLIFRGNIDETEDLTHASNTFHRKPSRATVPTSLKSRPPSTSTEKPPSDRFAAAIPPLPKSCWPRPERCSPCPKVPWNSVATAPSSMSSKTQAATSHPTSEKPSKQV